LGSYQGEDGPKEETVVRVKEIREKARALGIKNIHRMRKTELIQLRPVVII